MKTCRPSKSVNIFLIFISLFLLFMFLFSFNTELWEPIISNKLQKHISLLIYNFELLLINNVQSLLRFKHCTNQQAILVTIGAINKEKLTKWLISQQMVAVILVTIGAIMSIKNFNNSFNNHHQRLGIGLYATVWFQALLGFLRPSRYVLLFWLFYISKKKKHYTDSFLATKQRYAV